MSFDKLIMSVALGNRDTDTLTSVAGRLARLDREINEQDKKEIQDTAKGKSLGQIVNSLLDAIDPDKQIEEAQKTFKTKTPNQTQIKQATEQLIKTVCTPFDDPKLRNLLIDIKRRNEQIIDTVSKDTVLSAGFDGKAKDKARGIIDSFKKFIDENKDELTALQIIYNKPYGQRHLTYEQINQLANAIEKPPYHLTTDRLWQAYEQLEKSKVKGAGPQRLLTDIISLIGFTIGEAKVLEPYSIIIIPTTL